MYNKTQNLFMGSTKIAHHQRHLDQAIGQSGKKKTDSSFVCNKEQLLIFRL
jgi:hypothetical protein